MENKFEIYKSGVVYKYLDLYLHASFDGLKIEMRHRNEKYAFTGDITYMDKQTTIPFLGVLKPRQIQEMRGEGEGSPPVLASG